MSDWAEYKLGDVTEWSSGGTPSKADDTYWNGDIPWISASSMSGNRYSTSDRNITLSGLNAGSKLAKKDTILLLVRGSILHQRIPVGIADRDVSFNQDVKGILAKREFLEPWFLLLWFMANEKKLLTMVESTGIGAGKLDTKQLQDLMIKIPPIKEREKITSFGKSLDSKITLNRQINQTLEAMAQALFKSWFVDFEPVKAKLSALAVGGSADDANLAAMSAISGKTTEQLLTLKTSNPDQYQQLFTTADLFPSEMVDSELGEIPKGWEVGTVGDVAKAKGGYAFKSTDFSDKGCPVIKIKNITGNGTVDIEQDSCVIQSATIKTDRFRLYDGDLVMAMTGATVGKIGLINTYGLDIYINQRVAFFESDRYGKKISWFLFCLFNTQDAFQFVVGAAQGSAQPNISSTGIEMTPTVIPCQNTMESFLNQVDNLFRRWLANNSECVVLSDLRDSLLPKLLAGELVVDGVSDDV